MHANEGDGSCGQIRESPFVSVEAMIYAVQSINADPDILPGVSLCFDIHDTCGISNIALEETVALLMEVGPAQDGISGIVGAAQSDVSISVASLLRIFKVPQISYISTAAVLSDRQRFDYFFRTIPADTYQARAMASLIVHFNWSYVIGIYTDDTYGRGGINAVIEELSQHNETDICMVTDDATAIPPHASAARYDRVLRFINQHWVRNSTVVVFFGQQREVRGLMDAIKRSEVSYDNITWIASDAWATNMPDEYHDMIQGLLGVVPRTHYVEKFVAYYESLTPSNDSGNPWFEEYWEREFNCSLGTRESPELPRCDDQTQRLTYDNSTAGSTSEYVIDAVYAFAHAIENLLDLFCPNGSGLCDEVMVEMFSHEVLDGTKLREQLYNVSFTSPTSNKVFFGKTGGQDGFYDIVNMGRKGVREIGTWSSVGSLEITDDIEWHNDGGVPLSVCSLPCGSGEEPVLVPDQSDCCWTCEACPGENTVSTGENCFECSEGSFPNVGRNSCDLNPITHLTWSSPWAIVILIVTGLGLAMTAFVVVIFIIFNKHRIIKATSRELSVILLTGIALCYALPFVFIATPSPATCTIRRFGIGFCFSLCFSPLLIKTNRIYRVFHQAPRTPRFAGPRSQVVFTFMLISVQVVIATVWLVLERPGVKFIYKTRETEKACGESPYVGLPVSLIYNLLLLILTTFYAFLARKIPAKFNETKFIAITLYSICVVWLGFFPTYFATIKLGTVYQASTLVFAVLISATTTLGCLFVPKVIILFMELGQDKKIKPYSRSSITNTSSFSDDSSMDFRRLD